MKHKIDVSKQGKQAIVLYITSFVGIIMGVLSSIINTRYLDPIEYGDVKYVQNIINFIATFLLVGYFNSGSRLLALNDDKEYCRRVKGVMSIILLFTILLMILFCILCSFLHLNKSNISKLFLVSIPVCSYPILLNYLNTTAQGDNQIGHLTIARLVPALLYVPLAYCLYRYTGASSVKIILLQWGIPICVYLIVILVMKPKFSQMSLIWDELKSENKQYGFHLYVGAIVMVATNYIAGISLGHFNMDNSEVGFYTLALTVTSPLMTLPAIIGTTYFKKFASEPKIPKKVLLETLVLTIFTCVVFVVFIKKVVLFLYSEDYAIVGTYCIWLSIGFCCHGLGDMINRYLGSHGRGKDIRNGSIVNGVLKVLGYTILVYYFNTFGAIFTTIICDIIYLLMMYMYYKKFTEI